MALWTLRLLLAAAPLTTVVAASVTSLPAVGLETGASCACAQIYDHYGSGSVIFANSTNYTIETTDFWDVRSDMDPRCIFFPKSADEVSSAITIFSSCGTQFAIRGGGHMNYPGSNNINGGVLLALDNLSEVGVASDNKTVDAGPGATWYDVYETLAPFGLYCIGGRLKTIGVPGLSLLGGFHYLINTYGMAMDNIFSYDVVLGNGTQVVVNVTSNRDLFWALKDGVNNFGVVTKFTINALPIPKISTTVQEYNESAVADFIEATVNLASNDGPDIAAGSVISITYNVTLGTVTPMLMGVQEGTESPPSRFANFSKIASVTSDTNVLTPVEWHSQLDTPFQMFRVQFAHKTMKPDAAQLYRIYESWKAAVDRISDVEGLYPTFVMNVLPKSALSVAKNNGIGNTWGLDDDQSYILWQFSTGWADKVDDLRMLNWARQLLDYWHADNMERGLASDFMYGGDAGDFQDIFTGYPRENIEKMTRIREAYDPLGVFTRLNWGGFKLGNE